MNRLRNPRVEYSYGFEMGGGGGTGLADSGSIYLSVEFRDEAWIRN